jgi:RNA polymerase sigma factor (sigma-70 family)
MGYALQEQPDWHLEQHEQHLRLVEGCVRGDRQAQFELYRLYSKAMFNTCLRMLGNREDAEDILQNVFVDVFGKLETFRHECTIGAWIKRVTVNNCINFLKKRRLLLSSFDDHLSVLPQSEESEPPEVAFDIGKVQLAVSQLSDGYRAIFTLYAFEGYDHQEIADIMGITPSTSKSQFSRAKERVRQLLTSKEA